MTTFNVMIDDFGRIELPEIVTDILNTNEPGDSLTIGIELDEKGKPRISLTSDIMEVENPKINTTKEEKPKEKEIIYYFSEYNEKSNIVRISKEQERLLDWLCENDYIRGDVDLGLGYPYVEDLTK